MGEYSGKSTAKAIAQLCRINDAVLVDLMDDFMSDDLRRCQKSIMTLELILKDDPDKLSSYIPEMIKLLHSPKNSGSIRNVLRTIQFMTIPEEYTGPIFDYSFSQITNLKAAIAVRAFSMEVAYKIAMPYPELLDEILVKVTLCLEDESAGVRSKAKHIKKRIESKRS